MVDISNNDYLILNGGSILLGHPVQYPYYRYIDSKTLNNSIYSAMNQTKPNQTKFYILSGYISM